MTEDDKSGKGGRGPKKEHETIEEEKADGISSKKSHDDDDDSEEEQSGCPMKRATRELLRFLYQNFLHNKKRKWNIDPKTRQKLLTCLALSVASVLGAMAARRRRQRGSGVLLGGGDDYNHTPDYRSASTAPLSLLYQSVKEGNLEKALIGSSGVVYYLLKNRFDGQKQQQQQQRNRQIPRSWKMSNIPASMSQKDLIDQLADSCSELSILPEPLLTRFLQGPFLAALPFIYLAFLYKIVQTMLSQHRQESSGMDILNTTHSTNKANKLSFEQNVALNSPELLQDVQEIVTYLQNPTSYRRLGARPPRGVLLHGPPGNGKTLVAQVISQQANVDAFMATSASDFVQVYVGRGAARVRSLFQHIQQQAKANHQARRQQHRRQKRNRQRQQQGGYKTIPWMIKQKVSSLWYGNDYISGLDETDWSDNEASLRRPPTAILFIDELDALAKTRAKWNPNDEREQTLNQLLTEMDGFASVSKNKKRPAPTIHKNKKAPEQTSSVSSSGAAATSAAAAANYTSWPSLSMSNFNYYHNNKGASTENNDDDDDRTEDQTDIDGDKFRAIDSSDEEDDDDDDTVTLIVVSATNRADVLDPAIVRRFDRILQIGYPNEEARKTILKIHAKQIHTVDDDSGADTAGVYRKVGISHISGGLIDGDSSMVFPNDTTRGIDWNALAAQTDGFSGADLRNIINDAALLAVRESAEAVHQSHLEHAIRRMELMKAKASGNGDDAQHKHGLVSYAAVVAAVRKEQLEAARREQLEAAAGNQKEREQQKGLKSAIQQTQRKQSAHSAESSREGVQHSDSELSELE